MRLVKKSVAYALVAAMVVTLAPSSVTGAAKKVKLNKKAAPVEVGKTVKLKVQNAKKSAKVTWKSSKTKIAKIKKSTKKGNASATVAGVKKGKAVITAVVKTGKKKNTLKCTVTVKKASKPQVSASPAVPVVSASPSVQPTPVVTQNVQTPKPSPTKRPSPTPRPTPSPSPTPMPDKDDYKFAEVASGTAIDVSTYQGSGAYNEKTKRVEINDSSDADNSMGAWELPESIKIKDGDIVTFRVQGFNYGTSGFRFWIGNAVSGSCTPVQLTNTVTDENAKIGEWGYPCVVDAEGKEVAKWTSVKDKDGNTTYTQGAFPEDSVTKNQMALNIDEDKAFDVTFSFKAGASQNDTEGVYSHLTLKYIMGGGTSGYIDGLCIKNIYYISENGSGTTDPSTTPDPSTTEKPVEIKKVDFSTISLPEAKKGQESNYYNADANKIVVNDSADSSELYFKLPEKVEKGNAVDVTVKGSYTGDTGFRFWIGNGPDNKSEEVKVFAADFKQGDFEETFTMKAKDDACELFTIKGIPSWSGGKDYISGLEINEIAVAYPKKD